MRTTGAEMEESLGATEQQQQAADQVALTMVEIRTVAEQPSGEQAERLQLAERVGGLVLELEQLLERYGVSTRNGRLRATAASSASRPRSGFA